MFRRNTMSPSSVEECGFRNGSDYMRTECQSGWSGHSRRGGTERYAYLADENGQKWTVTAHRVHNGDRHR
jgi:hypothetical protein